VRLRACAELFELAQAAIDPLPARGHQIEEHREVVEPLLPVGAILVPDPPRQR